jgi:hypothetical protein
MGGWYCIKAGLYCRRTERGDVELCATLDKKDPSESNRIFEFLIDSGIWTSTVLTMTSFSERPNDWHAFMDHHYGRSDMLEAAKTLTAVRAITQRLAEAIALDVAATPR